MEIGVITLIVMAGLIAVAIGAALIRQFLLSHDKNVNDKNQKETLNQLSKENEKIRNHMDSPNRLSSYHQMLGTNKGDIDSITKQMNKAFFKKSRLMELYHLTENPAQKNQISEKIKNEIGRDIEFFNDRLQRLQNREEAQWAIQNENKQAMIEQLQSMNKNSDALYEKQTMQLGQVFLQTNQTAQQLAVESIHAGTEDFKSILMAPIQLFLRYFNLIPNVMLAPPQINFISGPEVIPASEEHLSMKQEHGFSSKKVSTPSSKKTYDFAQEELDPDLDNGIRLVFA